MIIQREHSKKEAVFLLIFKKVSTHLLTVLTTGVIFTI